MTCCERCGFKLHNRARVHDVCAPGPRVVHRYDEPEPSHDAQGYDTQDEVKKNGLGLVVRGLSAKDYGDEVIRRANELRAADATLSVRDAVHRVLADDPWLKTNYAGVAR